jgi:Ser/Thr protein kinase RdoA (MazF antagonist)
MASLLQKGEGAAGRSRHFFALGELLAGLHEQASVWQPPASFVRHALDADGLMGTSPFWGPFWQAVALTPAQQTYFRELRRRIHRILSGLATDPAQFSMIHADLHPGNVVVHGTRLHIIDFDDAGFGWHAYDFAVALKDFQKDPAFADLQTALVRGYRERRSIDDETLALIPLFLLVRALTSIGWADARPELGHPEYGPGLARQVEETAEAVLAGYH